MEVSGSWNCSKLEMVHVRAERCSNCLHSERRCMTVGEDMARRLPIDVMGRAAIEFEGVSSQ